MRKEKHSSVPLIVVLLVFSSLAFSGCLMDGGDDAPSVQGPGAALSGDTTRSGAAIAFAAGAWIAENAASQVIGFAAGKAVDKIMKLIFGDPLAPRLDAVMNQLSEMNGRVNLLASQVVKIHNDIDDLAKSLQMSVMDFNTTLTQRLAYDPLSSINEKYDMFSNLIKSVEAQNSREAVLENCTPNKFLGFAVTVEWGSPVIRTNIQQIHNMLVSGGLSSSGGGLLSLWADKAIIAYMKKQNRNATDLINCYNYIEMNFQHALMYEAKGAIVVLTALQCIGSVNPYMHPTAIEYLATYKGLLKSQTEEFRNQVERFVLTCADIKTSRSANFLPDGHRTVFNRLDFIYLMLAGDKDADGKSVYGLYGRVISPVDLAAAGGVSVSGSGGVGTLTPVDSTTCDSMTVAGASLVPRKIDVWKTEFPNGGDIPVSKFSISEKWYIYHYYFKGAVNDTYGGTPFSQNVTVELQNSSSSVFPVGSDIAAMASYDESIFRPDIAPQSGSRLVKYGDFTITAGFAGNSVFIALPKDSPKPYVWQSILQKTGNLANIILYTHADGDHSDGALPMFVCSATNERPTGGYPDFSSNGIYGDLAASIRKVIKVDGGSPVTARLHVNIFADGQNFNNMMYITGLYDDVWGIELLEASSMDFASANKLSDEILKMDVYGSNSTSKGTNQNNYRYASIISRNFTKDISVTFQPDKYYRLTLYSKLKVNNGDRFLYKLKSSGTAQELYLELE